MDIHTEGLLMTSRTLTESLMATPTVNRMGILMLRIHTVTRLISMDMDILMMRLRRHSLETRMTITMSIMGIVTRPLQTSRVLTKITIRTTTTRTRTRSKCTHMAIATGKTACTSILMATRVTLTLMTFTRTSQAILRHLITSLLCHPIDGQVQESGSFQVLLCRSPLQTADCMRLTPHRWLRRC
jgi:hypothetical protein